MFSLTDESEMGHIRLAREADLVVVAPATANIIAKMAAGIADNLASTVLLATDKPILLAPAMNVVMWQHPATESNVATVVERGVHLVGPDEGDLACGESGAGRMVEPLEIVDAIIALLKPVGALAGRRALVTSGPTHEPIDPVRYIANRSSGKQGHAVAAALAGRGAEAVLVTGPTHVPDPPGVQVVRVETAEQMLEACQQALPVEVAVCAAAVGDWHVANRAERKLKKSHGQGEPPALTLSENPDILATLAAPGSQRPQLVVGFAAETEDVVDNARSKRLGKGCDWMVANDVAPATGTFGGDHNAVHLVTDDGVESWPTLSKREVAERLAARIADHLAGDIDADEGSAPQDD
jgi:phosphopantothenoylcysteine decarboxylase/phosphopantothenate--cysteine ligase